jgi:hypothetical protein
MGGHETTAVDFFRDNLVLIGIIALVIFGYLVMIIRSRWQRNFLHRDEKKDKQS